VDVNNTPYILLRDKRELDHRASGLVWDEQRGALILAQDQELRLPAGDAEAALAAWETAVPLVYDGFGQVARIDPDTPARVQYNAGRGFLPLMDGELKPLRAPSGVFVDLAVGGDGRLAAAWSDGADTHGVELLHLGKRWRTSVALQERPRRVCVDADNRLWCVGANTLVLCEGEPLPQPYRGDSTRFEPEQDNPRPLRIVWQRALEAGDNALALCADREQLYCLTHNGEGQQFILAISRTPRPASAFKRYRVAPELPFAVDLGLLAPGRFALLVPRAVADASFRQRDCALVRLRWDESLALGETLPIRERYPMLSQAWPRFAGSSDGRLRYLAQVDADSAQATAGYPARPRELLPLQRPKYLSAAAATLLQELDSGRNGTIWHRLYLEGCIPAGCRIVIYAKTFESAATRAAQPFIRQPDWVWCSRRDEPAYGKGLVPARRNESGLFELLLQRSGGEVRRMSGRYLQLRIQMESDGRHTPAIHALKIYYPRFSYQEQYLPEHFRQEQQPDPQQSELPANGADLRERLLAAFESLLTPIETRIAASEVLLHPQHTPAAQLPWLGEALGQALPVQWPLPRQREWLMHSGELQQWRGTLAGIALALDIVTDGAVAKGQVVVVENFRLRRTMATILGIDMDDAEHPLTLGTGMSGNSIVGDSLILSEKDGRDFLALFAPELAQDSERDAVEDFFDRYGNQLTILLHGAARVLKDSVQQTLVAQVPAHLQWRVLESEHPFVLGLSPLLAIDTFIERQPPPRRVTLDDTYIGREGLLRNPVALSPRDVNARP